MNLKRTYSQYLLYWRYVQSPVLYHLLFACCCTVSLMWKCLMEKNFKIVVFLLHRKIPELLQSFQKIICSPFRKTGWAIDKSGLFLSQVALKVKNAKGWIFYLNLTAVVVPEWVLKKLLRIFLQIFFAEMIMRTVEGIYFDNIKW